MGGDEETNTAEITMTEISIPGYERVMKACGAGFCSFIAVHDTRLGPAIGGTRIYPYKNESEAMTDALRLSRGMTYKSALAGLDIGGGKAVIMCDPNDKSPQLLRTFAKFVDSFKGTFICGVDMNTNSADMAIIRTVTPHVSACGAEGVYCAFLTALGVFTSIEVTAKKLATPMTRLRVAVQGVGAVGRHLTLRLVAAGCTVFVADCNSQKVKEIEALGVQGVDNQEILYTECDILAPCAIGAVINDSTIDKLKCKAIVGAANNQLAELHHARLLRDRGIIYAPDYLVNAGGIINIAIERQAGGYCFEDAVKATENIGQRLSDIYDFADQHNITTAEAADRIAERRFTNVA